MHLIKYKTECNQGLARLTRMKKPATDNETLKMTSITPESQGTMKAYILKGIKEQGIDPRVCEKYMQKEVLTCSHEHDINSIPPVPSPERERTPIKNVLANSSTNTAKEVYQQAIKTSNWANKLHWKNTLMSREEYTHNQEFLTNTWAISSS